MHGKDEKMGILLKILEIIAYPVVALTGFAGGVTGAVLIIRLIGAIDDCLHPQKYRRRRK